MKKNETLMSCKFCEFCDGRYLCGLLKERDADVSCNEIRPKLLWIVEQNMESEDN